MSMDLAFWTYKEGASKNHQAIYKACSAGACADGLETLPIEKILVKIREKFSDWDQLDVKNYEKDGKGAFCIFTTPQFVRFDCYGMDGGDMDLLIDCMLEFGCPLYDPQIDARFDSRI